MAMTNNLVQTGRQTAQPTSVAQSYSTALDRWLKRQRTATQQYKGAEQPIQDMIGLYSPGGGFGAGQIAQLETSAKQERARAMTQQVASGMSSGSLSTSTGIRIGSDLAKAKLGVEDTRTQFMNQALQMLSGLRGQQAGQTAATYDPYFNTALGARGQERGQDISAFDAARDRTLQRAQLTAARKEADRQYQLQIKQFDAAQKELDPVRKDKQSTTTGSASLTR